jgi:hypothetical protein
MLAGVKDESVGVGLPRDNGVVEEKRKSSVILWLRRIEQGSLQSPKSTDPFPRWFAGIRDTVLASDHPKPRQAFHRLQVNPARLQNLLLCPRIVGSLSSDTRQNRTAAGLLSGEAPVTLSCNRYHHSNLRITAVT